MKLCVLCMIHTSWPKLILHVQRNLFTNKLLWKMFLRSIQDIQTFEPTLSKSKQKLLSSFFPKVFVNPLYWVNFMIKTVGQNWSCLPNLLSLVNTMKSFFWLWWFIPYLFFNINKFGYRHYLKKINCWHYIICSYLLNV